MQPIIYFASDHAGFTLKNELLAYVRDTLGYEVHDCGAYIYDEHDDFTDFIAVAAREISARSGHAKAIILGGSGQGEAMLANRFHDVRAAVFYGGDKKIITLSREHNDANVLSLGARFLDTEEAKEAVALWLSTAHADEAKYDRRINEMEAFSSAQRNVLPKRNIVPSLPAASFDEIERIGTLLRNISSGLQIDIVDNVFAPHTSWPFTQADPKSELLKLKEWSSQFEMEIDCMCMDPLQYLDLFVEIGVMRVVIHAGSTEEYAACIAHAHEHKYAIGLAVTNDTDLQVLNTLSSSIDFIQVMGIEHIGQQGQQFDERTLDTVAKLRKIHPYMEIAVDGAVNERTIPHLLQAGVTRFAPGSAVAKAPDPVSAYTHLASMIGL
jgi:ribose 5-phosphate isomerase B